MTISAKMILDSVSPHRIRLRAMQLRYPKFIHNELMTHRVFSRNASSSRAIPIARLIQDVRDDTAIPLKWFSNRPGMQGGEEIIGEARDRLIEEWMNARDDAIERACNMSVLGAHKQHANRLLEPFCHINVLVTSTNWANWDLLRDHADAQPEMAELAKQIKIASDASTPGLLQAGQWHLPYVTPDDWLTVNDNGDSWNQDHIKTLIKISVARCARVSYLTQEGKAPVIKKDLELYDRLVAQVPLHASPAEHQASPDTTWGPEDQEVWAHPAWHGNFSGWIQFRKTLKDECAYDEPYHLAEPEVVLDTPEISVQSTVSTDLSAEPVNEQH